MNQIEWKIGDVIRYYRDRLLYPRYGEKIPTPDELAHQIAELRPQGDDEGLLSPEAILTIAQKTKGKWATNEWLAGEGADFKAGILVGSEAQRDLTRQEIPEAVKQERERVGKLVHDDTDNGELPMSLSLTRALIGWYLDSLKGE